MSNPKDITIYQKNDSNTAFNEVTISGSNLVLQTNDSGVVSGSSDLNVTSLSASGVVSGSKLVVTTTDENNFVLFKSGSKEIAKLNKFGSFFHSGAYFQEGGGFQYTNVNTTDPTNRVRARLATVYPNGTVFDLVNYGPSHSTFPNEQHIQFSQTESAILKIKNGNINLATFNYLSASFDIPLKVKDDLIVDGTIIANEFLVTEITRSVLYESGSTKFGDTLDDTHNFTGSVTISGSLNVIAETNTVGSTELLNTYFYVRNSNTKLALSANGDAVRIGNSDFPNGIEIRGDKNARLISLTSFTAPLGADHIRFNEGAEDVDFEIYKSGSGAGIAYKYDSQDRFHIFSGSVSITGSNITVNGSQVLTTADTIVSSSYSETSSYALNVPTIDTSSFITSDQTSSMSVESASYAQFAQTVLGGTQNADTASYIEGSNVDGTVTSASYSVTSSYALNVQTVDTSSLINQNQTSSMSVLNAETASYVQGSNVDGIVELSNTSSYIDYSNIDNVPSGIVSGSSQVVSLIDGQDVTLGTVTADELFINEITRSVLYESGSTKFGDTQDDTHQFTGSVSITGSSLTFNGNNVITSDITVDSASYSETSSYFLGDIDTNKVIHVNPESSDSTDSRNNISNYDFTRPFATLTTAISASVSGDYLLLYPSLTYFGTEGFVELKDGITIYQMQGSSTAFDTSGSGAATILGYGFAQVRSQANQNMIITAKGYMTVNISDGWVGNGSLNLNVDTFRISGTTPIASGSINGHCDIFDLRRYNEGSDIDIECRRMTRESTTQIFGVRTGTLTVKNAFIDRTINSGANGILKLVNCEITGSANTGAINLDEDGGTVILHNCTLFGDGSATTSITADGGITTKTIKTSHCRMTKELLPSGFVDSIETPFNVIDPDIE